MAAHAGAPAKRAHDAPYYLPLGEEIELFEAAYHAKLPVLLKGPTGCGKTRFVEHMSWRLNRPLITVACNEDLSASDLVGRYLIIDNQTVWQDGPLTQGARCGAITYLDEIVEARNDTVVLIHPLTDHRRILPIDKLGKQLEADAGFCLVLSFNPGYQSVRKELKASTRQRFVSIEFSFPTPDKEAQIVAHESGADFEVARKLVYLGGKIRSLAGSGLEEQLSTRLLIYTGKLMGADIAPLAACEAAMIHPLTDDRDLQRSLLELAKNYFG
ncbi:MAG TPA: CbbQ/NirQ/NorQ/GpvN family protein [Candidatus Bipolaricaulota bacterium]